MEFVSENWPILIAVVAVIIVAIIVAEYFLNLPTKTQLQNIKEWLLWAMIQAEQDLGDKTGEIKLRQTYDRFVMRFPFLSETISFTCFRHLVDEELDEMREIMRANENIKKTVEGKTNHE